MIAIVHWMCGACVAMASVSDVREVRWDADGISCSALIQRVSDCSGDAFAIRADLQRADRSVRLHCSSESIAEAQALMLAESVYGLSRWKVGGTSIWMDTAEVPGLIAADIQRRQGGWTQASNRGRIPGDKVIGSVELDDSTLAESSRAVALAFGVPIVYSSGCDVSTDGISNERLSLSLDGVDRETCLSLMAERFNLEWSVLEGLVYLAPIAQGANRAAALRERADLRDGLESVTDPESSHALTRGRAANMRLLFRRNRANESRSKQSEAERLCRELELRD